jgi:phosphoglycerol transferase MdoB-like AlkP superfamily enzyme
MDFTNFYLGAATAAATLVGLLFIAIQINLDTFSREPDNRWRAVGRLTFTTFVMLFILPLMFLIPKVTDSLRGAVILLAVGISVLRILQAWLPVWRGVFRGRGERVWQTAWLLVGPLLVYIYLGTTGLALLRGTAADSVDLSIAFVLVSLFSLALRNSWNLLVEVAAERKRTDAPSGLPKQT